MSNQARITVVTIAILAAGCSHVTPSGRRVLYYYDPMHPSYRSDHPGTAPDCNMALVPRFADEETGSSAIRLTPAQERLSGIDTVEVTERDGHREIRAPARVLAADSRRYEVSAGGDGLIRSVEVGSLGAFVRKGEQLATYISRDVSTPQQGYIYALNAVDRVRSAPKATEDQIAPALRQLDVAGDALKQLGMDDDDLAELRRTRSELREFRFRAPVDGVVTVRNAAPGAQFAKGDKLFEIASIDPVWIDASIFASDIGALAKVSSADIMAPDGTRIRARRVPAVARFESDAPRTASVVSVVRLEATNPTHRLLPGMYATAIFDVQTARALTVPTESVVDSGSGAHVFVRRNDGAFETRRITTGWRAGGYIQVSQGLQGREVVARSGVFLLDSESRIEDNGIIR